MATLLDLEKQKFNSSGEIKVSGDFAVAGQTDYSTSDITALGSSTNLNDWVSAFHDGQLTYKYVQEYNGTQEKVVYVTHPSLGDGNKCLRLFKIYSTQNNTLVLQGVKASVADWTFDGNVQGTVSITLGTITSPAANAIAGTDVCSVSITNTGGGSSTLSLSGANASLYQLNNTTQGQTGSTLSNVATTDTVVIETASNFQNVTYSHNLSVTITESAFGLNASQNITTSGSQVAGFSNEFALAGRDTTTQQSDFDIVGTEKSIFPSKGGGTNYFPELADVYSISFWLNAPKATGSKYVPIIQMLAGTNNTDTQLKIYGTSTATRITFHSNANARKLSAGISDTSIFSDNTGWRHCVITKSSGTFSVSRFRLYVDGVDKGLFSGQNSTLNTSDFTAKSITKTRIGGTFFSATSGSFLSRESGVTGIDQIKSFDIELSQAQVTELYNSGKPQSTSDLSFASNIDAEFLCGDGDNDDVVNHKAYDTHDSNRYIEKFGTGTHGIEQLTMNDSIYKSDSGNHKYVQSPAIYSLSGGDTNGYTQPTGRIGAYQNIDPNKRLFGAASSNAAVSVSLWYNQTATPTSFHNLVTAFLIDNSDTTKSAKWAIQVGSDDIIYNNTTITSTTYQTGGGATTDNTWRHFVLTIETDPSNSSNFLPKIYINGTLQALGTTGSLAKSTLPYIFDTTGYTNYGFAINGATVIGHGHGVSSAANTSDIRIDELSTYNIALSQSQITAIWNNGSPTDLTGHTGIEHWFRMGDGPNDTGTSIACNFHPGTTMTSTQDYTQNH